MQGQFNQAGPDFTTREIVDLAAEETSERDNMTAFIVDTSNKQGQKPVVRRAFERHQGKVGLCCLRVTAGSNGVAGHQPDDRLVQRNVKGQQRHLCHLVVLTGAVGDLFGLGKATRPDEEFENGIIKAATGAVGVGRDVVEQTEGPGKQVIGQWQVFVNQHNQTEGAKFKRISAARCEDAGRVIAGWAVPLGNQPSGMRQVATLERLHGGADHQDFVLADEIGRERGESAVERLRPIQMDEEICLAADQALQSEIGTFGMMVGINSLRQISVFSKGLSQGKGGGSRLGAAAQDPHDGRLKQSSQRAIGRGREKGQQSVRPVAARGKGRDQMGKVWRRERFDDLLLQKPRERIRIGIGTGQEQGPSGSCPHEAAGLDRAKPVGQFSLGDQEIGGAKNAMVGVEQGPGQTGKRRVRALCHHQPGARREQCLQRAGGARGRNIPQCQWRDRIRRRGTLMQHHPGTGGQLGHEGGLSHPGSGLNQDQGCRVTKDPCNEGRAAQNSAGSSRRRRAMIHAMSKVRGTSSHTASLIGRAQRLDRTWPAGLARPADR